MLRIAFLLLTLLTPLLVPALGAAKCANGETAPKRFVLGERPKLGVTYRVTATTFGTTSWDDNGIAYWNGKAARSREVKWLVAELGYGSGMMRLGDLPQGSRMLVTYPGSCRSVVAVLGEVGGGEVGAGIDLYDATAQALGIPDRRWFMGVVHVTLLRRPFRLRPYQTAADLPGTGPVSRDEARQLRETALRAS